MEKKTQHIIFQSSAALKGQVVHRGLNPESATLEQCNKALQYLASETMGDTHEIALIAFKGDSFFYSTDGKSETLQFLDKFKLVATAISHNPPYTSPLACVAQTLNAIAGAIDKEKPKPRGIPTRIDKLASYQHSLAPNSRLQ